MYKSSNALHKPVSVLHKPIKLNYRLSSELLASTKLKLILAKVSYRLARVMLKIFNLNAVAAKGNSILCNPDIKPGFGNKRILHPNK